MKKGNGWRYCPRTRLERTPWYHPRIKLDRPPYQADITMGSSTFKALSRINKSNKTWTLHRLFTYKTATLSTLLNNKIARKVSCKQNVSAITIVRRAAEKLKGIFYFRGRIRIGATKASWQISGDSVNAGPKTLIPFGQNERALAQLLAISVLF